MYTRAWKGFRRTGHIIQLHANGFRSRSDRFSGSVLSECTSDKMLSWIVSAIEPCKLWAINRQSFQAIMMATGLAKYREYENFLKR